MVALPRAVEVLAAQLTSDGGGFRPSTKSDASLVCVFHPSADSATNGVVEIMPHCELGGGMGLVVEYDLQPQVRARAGWCAGGRVRAGCDGGKVYYLLRH